MAKILVVYCSMSGNTKVAAEAVAEGARTSGAEVLVKCCAEAGPEDLTACDAVALGSYDAFSYYVALRIMWRQAALRTA